MTPATVLRTGVLTVLTLIAFAANSVLCRMALDDPSIDPATFTVVRIAAGVVALVPLAWIAGARNGGWEHGSWGSALALFSYAIAFSYAYLSLDAGMGALILFAVVQVTMIGVGLKRGERPRPAQWLGLVVAMGGLIYLVSPGLAAPDPRGAALMAVAGVAWGIYSLRGQGGGAPLAATAGNFLRAAPLAVVVAVVFVDQAHAEPRGLLLAAASGAIASGVGYALWYAALPGLATTTAGIVQLSVPAIAALGGVALLDERLTWRLLLAGAVILGGVAVAILGRRRAGP